MNLNQLQKDYLNSLLQYKNIKIDQIKNSLVKQYIEPVYSSSNLLTNDFDIYQICQIFTPNFNNNERKKAGITFTPLNLVEFMYHDVLDYSAEKLLSSKIADLAVGNGAFFVALVLYLKKKNINFSVVKFIENNLFGYDIKEENIEAIKLILSLLAIYYDEDVERITFNIYNKDAIDFYLENKDDSIFDIIVGNPPYVKQQNIDKEYRIKLERNFSTISSNYNLYYAFIEMATNLIGKEGKVLLLVPNYLLKIKSAIQLRRYLLAQNLIEKIIDFKYFKLFDNIDTYSMILQLSKNSNDFIFKTANNSSLLDLEKSAWQKMNLSEVENVDSINLTNEIEKKLINQVIFQPYMMDISTGIATQKDKLYLIDEIVELDKETKFFKIIDNIKYEIEPKLIKKIIKGSGASKSSQTKEQYIIFPYETDGPDNVNLIPPYILEKEFPLTYHYFQTNKEYFFKRSCNLDDSDWYKYGRTQALTKDSPKIIFPTNSNRPQFKYFSEKALFYNGYAIFGIKNSTISEKEMRAISIILNSDLVNIFINLTSYFIGGGYLSYQKKYIEKFRLPYLTEKNINRLFQLSDSLDKDALNRYVFELYHLDYNDYADYLKTSN